MQDRCMSVTRNAISVSVKRLHFNKALDRLRGQIEQWCDSRNQGRAGSRKQPSFQRRAGSRQRWAAGWKEQNQPRRSHQGSTEK